MNVQLPEPGHDDQQLVRYLLGLLPDEDAERLDELGITDDELAWRLRIVENDLVDDYVSGALTGETLSRFESFYLSSERRRQKVRFARELLRLCRSNLHAADSPPPPPQHTRRLKDFGHLCLRWCATGARCHPAQ